MARLSELTDVYYEEPIELPPARPLPVDIPRVVISGNVGIDNIVRPTPDYVNPPANNPIDKLAGATGERYQLWPEKIIRDGIKAAGEIMEKGAVLPGLRREDYTDIPAPDMPTKDSTALGKALNIAPVAWDPQDKIIEDAQAMSALAGSGGLAGGVEGAALNATPSLRPALRYKDKLYKGKEGQQHLDVIPENLYPDFQKKAMSGQDINEYNFGFINDKGQFLTREKALEYGINTGLIDPAAGKYGALTSTLMADSSKPGTAIEAVGKTFTKTPEFKNWFGDSKVVDKIGEPITVYHGTNQPIEQFDLARGGIATGDNAGTKKAFFFTDNKDVAAQYAANAGERVVSNIAKFEKDQAFLKKEVDRLEKVAQKTGNWEPYEKAMSKWEDLEIGATREAADVGANIVDTHLSIKNPMEVDFKGGRLTAAKDMDALIDKAKTQGYDGLILKNLEDSPKMGVASNQYVVFDPTQIKSASKNSGKFDPKNPVIFKADSSKEGAALQANKPMFYSAVEHNVNAIPQSKMTGDQWLGTLANKPGVKPEEMQWTGLTDFLAENKGKPVTKEQIQEHLASNKVELKEVTKDQGQNLDSRYTRSTDPNFTKYHSYQLPGGDGNYREVLLTLPKRDGPFQLPDGYKLEPYKIGNGKEKFGIYDDKGNRFASGDTVEAAQQRFKDLHSNIGTYKSSHWDEPNILAHVRMNDRTIDGKKSLHVEEIQSDWHQQGRDKGYKTNHTSEYERMKKDLIKKYDAENYPQALKKATAEEKSAMDNITEKAIMEQENPTRDRLVPDAPFKKTWHELALKRMLREAAEKGYDRLSWTPGEAQAARYDLSKQIEALHYTKTEKGEYMLAPEAIGGREVPVNNGQPIPKDKIADYVGKEMAEKILKGPDDLGVHTIKGDGLKIGGEGMKGFYDVMVPKYLEKLGKEHGVKVKKDYVANKEKEWPFSIRVASDGKKYWLEGKDPRLDHSREVKLSDKFDSFENADVVRERFYKGETEPVFYIDIPQSLKDQALQKGFPLFSAGGYMLMPVVGNPFAPESQK